MTSFTASRLAFPWPPRWSFAPPEAMRYRFTFLLLATLGLILTLAPARATGQEGQEPPAKSQGPAGELLSLETNLVVLNVTITDGKERYVVGLTANDFSILEDNVPQRIASFNFEEMPFAAVILMDTSASMDPKMSLARAACARFAGGIRDGDVVAIYSFGGTTVKMLQDFTESRDVHPLVWEARAEGETPLYDGLVKAAEALAKRPERRRAILLVSDGADTKSRATLEEAMRKVITSGVAVYAVDLSDSALYRGLSNQGAEVLKTLATKTGGRFFRTPGGSKLRDAFAQAVEELRNQYTITYEPTNDRQDGRWRVVQVRVTNPKLNVRTRQGYQARKSRGEGGG